jgi:hypothetical protein
MRFVSSRDLTTITKINQELINNVVDVNCIIYKLHPTLSKTNSYGESTRKSWLPGVQVPMLMDRQDTNPTEQLQTVDVSQDVKFGFLRYELQQRNIYPEQGDVIWFDNNYYEIHNTNENQLWGGHAENKIAIVCECHLTRITNLQIEKPIT